MAAALPQHNLTDLTIYDEAKQVKACNFCILVSALVLILRWSRS